MRNNQVIYLGVRLLTICLVAGLLLGLVYNITLPYKEAADAAALQESLETVCPGGTFTEIDPAADASEDVLHLYTYTADAGTGYVAVVQSMGYKGEVPVTVCVDDAGTVRAISVGSHEETVGIGDQIGKESFQSQFVGLSYPVTGTAQTITGASYSSGAVITAVDLAFEAIEQVKGA